MTPKGFSFNRLTGISSAKGKLSRAIGIPLSKSGRRKKGSKILSGCGCFLGVLVLLLILIGALSSIDRDSTTEEQQTSRTEQDDAEKETAQSATRLAEPAISQEPAREWRTVKRVIDGDTLELENGEKVRLIGVDTPETVDPRKPVERFGKEASEFTRKLCEGKRVWLEYDQTRSDKYLRTLAYVHLEDGRVLNEEIIRYGYGHAYTEYPFKHMEKYRELERQAREAETGLWAKDEPKPAPTPQRIEETPRPVPVARPQPPPEPTPSVTVYVTRTGSKYHSGGCRYLRKSCIPMSLEDAKKRYDP